MLRANLMVAADDGLLEQRPDVLHRVAVNLASRIFPFRVVNRFVFGVVVCHAPVGFPLVGIDGLNVTGDVLTNETVQGFPISTPDHLKEDVPITLKGTHDHGLVALVATPLAFDLATYKRLIGLEDALQE